MIGLGNLAVQTDIWSYCGLQRALWLKLRNLSCQMISINVLIGLLFTI